MPLSDKAATHPKLPITPSVLEEICEQLTPTDLFDATFCLPGCSDSQHLHTQFLKKRKRTSLSNLPSPTGTGASKPSTELPICTLYNSPTLCHWPCCKFHHICVAPECGKKHLECSHYYGLQTPATRSTSMKNCDNTSPPFFEH